MLKPIIEIHDNDCPKKIQPKQKADTGESNPKLDTKTGDKYLIP